MPRGKELLRIIATPSHSDNDIHEFGRVLRLVLDFVERQMYEKVA